MNSEQEIFRRLNSLEVQVAEMRGSLTVLEKSIPRAIVILGAIALLELAVIVYGAVGERGLKAVRDAVPVARVDIVSPGENARIWSGRSLA